MTDGDGAISGTAISQESEWGIYLIGDSPLKMHPLALDDGTGDKKLLAEAIDERLEKEELDDLINDLIAASVERARREEVEA